MSRRPTADTLHSIRDALHSIRIVDEGYGVIVADSPQLLWDAMQGALRRRQEGQRAPLAAMAGPVDFAAAMRRVEDEVYDAD